MVDYLILITLFFIPLLVLPFGVSWFETPKIITTELLVIVSAGLIFWKTSLKHVLHLHTPFLICFSALLVLTVMHAVLYQSFLGNIFRLQGLILMWILLVWGTIVAFKTIQIPAFLPLLTLSGLLLGTLLFGAVNGRFVSTLGEPNAYAAMLVFLVPFLITVRDKYAKWVGIWVIVGLILLTQSRSGILALTFELVFLLLIHKMKLKPLYVLGITLILITASLILPAFQQHVVFENRWDIWQTAFWAGFRHPFIGSGFGNITEALHLTSRTMSNVVQYEFVDSSHNIFLDWWVQGGIVGVGILLSMIGFSFYYFLQKKTYHYISLLIGLLTCLLFNPASISLLIPFWWIMGKGASLHLE